jgi:hypothetical protein
MTRLAFKMTDGVEFRTACRAAAWAAVLFCVLAVALMPARAQEQNVQEPPEQPAQKDGRGGGLIEALGDFFDKAAEGLSLKGATDTITDLNRKAGEATRDAAKSATDNLGRLPGARVASGRSLCVMAANNAPDCGAAAIALCKSKGFGGGASVATESGEKCPAQVWLSGRSPRPGECKIETFVTSAMCQ